MEINIITLFPELFDKFQDWSMIRKAREIEALKIEIHDLRNWAIDERGTVDSRPYGGGPGMILRPEPIFNAINSLAASHKNLAPKKILLSAKGETFNQQMAEDLSQLDEIILICGHYEGVDERIRQYLVDEEISIGNYVLSGGELPAMVITDAVSRLLPQVLEKEGAAEIESFSPGLKNLSDKHQPLAANHEHLIEFPQYTRPENFQGWQVPDILLSGNHQKIEKWRAKQIKQKKND